MDPYVAIRRRMQRWPWLHLHVWRGGALNVLRICGRNAVERGWSMGNSALGGSTARDSSGSDCDVASDGCSSGSTDESGDVSNVTGLSQWAITTSMALEKSPQRISCCERSLIPVCLHRVLRLKSELQTAADASDDAFAAG